MAAHSSSSLKRPADLPAFLQQTKADVHAKFVELEWQQRDRLLQGTKLSDGPPSEWARISGHGISARNRYQNVEPFAQNRVRLRVNEGSNDYINASPIQLGDRKYIATQGPKDTSVNHFYRMLASETGSTAVVVMLTQTHEAGREKCFQYYPLTAEESPLSVPVDEDIQDGFRGDVTLERIEADERTRSEHRTMRLRVTTDKRKPLEKEISHLLFSAWPDFLIPEGDDRDALVELVRLSSALTRPGIPERPRWTHGGLIDLDDFAEDLLAFDPQNPRIVHCSAGVGRSGTFIALDYLLTLLHSSQLDNLPPDRDPIVETVDRLRRQRMMMVQGEPQFHFLYDVLREQATARIEAMVAERAV